MMKSKLVMIAALTGTVLLGAGCTKRLPKEGLESSIKTVYDKKGVAFKSVTCPAGREFKANDTFDCTATLAEGGNATIAVKQKDDKGNLGYDLAGVVVTAEGLAKAISGPNDKVVVTCPKKVAVLRKGESETCDASEGEMKGKVIAKASDDEQKIDYHVEITGKPPVDKAQAAADDAEDTAAPTE